MDFTKYVLALRFAVLNLAGFALLGAAYMQGLVTTALTADSTGLTALIGAVFLAGLGLTGAKVWRTSRDLNRLRQDHASVFEFRFDSSDSVKLRLADRITPVRNVANSLVLLGLIGTVLGFIIALGGVDPAAAGDVTKIAPMISTLISGMSTALYTTLVGAVLNVWLMANYRLLEHGAVKLIFAMEKNRALYH